MFTTQNFEHWLKLHELMYCNRTKYKGYLKITGIYYNVDRFFS